MFIRFVCNKPHPTVDAELGMFTAREEIDFSLLRGSVQRANEEAFYWFKAGGGGGLYRPRLRGTVRTSNIRKSLFWFKADAEFFHRRSGLVVDRARELAMATTAAGCEIREIKTTNPGRIIWEDGKQVLALPDKGGVPKAFSQD